MQSKFVTWGQAIKGKAQSIPEDNPDPKDNLTHKNNPCHKDNADPEDNCDPKDNPDHKKENIANPNNTPDGDNNANICKDDDLDHDVYYSTSDAPYSQSNYYSAGVGHSVVCQVVPNHKADIF